MMRRAISAALLLLALASTASAACSVSATQTLSNQWNDGTSDYYQYYITVTNTGADSLVALVSVQTAAAASAINIAQSWNLERLASTDETGHTAIFAVANILSTGDVQTITIQPGASWTSSGYVSKGAQTTVTGYVQLCNGASESASASSTEESSSSAAAPSSSSAESSSSSAPSTSGSSSACQFSVTLSSVTAGQSWSDGSYKYTQFSLSITNTGSQTLNTAQTFIYFNAGNSATFPNGEFGTIDQAWNMAVVPETEGAIGYAPGAVYAVSAFQLQAGQTFAGAGFIFKVPMANLASEADYDYPFGASAFQAQC